jgi:hypothetical protein
MKYYKKSNLKKGIKFQKGKDYCSLYPDKFLNVCYSECCFWHDRAYRNELKKRPSRLKSDWDLAKCVSGKYINHYGKRWFLFGWFWGIKMFLGVRLFGWRFWE